MGAPGIVPTEQVYAGDTWTRVFTFTQNGAAVNLVSAGWTGWRAQWRPAAGAAASLTITVDASNAATGGLTLSLSSSQTEQMGGDGVWDLEGTNGASTITVLRGQTTWTQDVTR